MKEIILIAIDGTAGSGKSTLGRRLSEKLRVRYIDSGAMYRAVGIAALDSEIDLEDKNSLGQFAESLDICMIDSPTGLLVGVNGVDYTGRIRTPKASAAASAVAIVNAVRSAVTRKLLLMSSTGAVMEGRDIGTVVIPQAKVKFYLDASLSVRAERRGIDHEKEGHAISRPRLLDELKGRDYRDRSRKEAPLKPARDAIVIDTSDRTLDSLEGEMLGIIQKRYELNR